MKKTSSGRVSGIELISMTGVAPAREKLYQKTQHFLSYGELQIDRVC